MPTKLLIVLITAMSSIVLVAGATLAQDAPPTADTMTSMAGMDSMLDTPACDVQTFMLQQQAYATALGNFEQTYAADPDAALRSVYNISLAYRAFAESCGYVPDEAADHRPDADHDAAAGAHSSEAHVALAMSLGDSDNGQALFNTVIPATGFACATCHRVDSTETLIGPGLVNVANPAHDPSHHEHGGEAAEATSAPDVEKTMDEVVAYLRTSIRQPSVFVVPGFPDLLMPQVYGQILTEQQINDVIAYLLTLHE